MISCIAWVPAGVADPNPKKYELSATEQELITMMEKQTVEDEKEPTKTNSASKNKTKSKKLTSESEDQHKSKSADHGLPADLRMDEYSSDEGENDDAVAGSTIGNLLVAPDDSDSEGKDEHNARNNVNAKENDMEEDDDEDDDDDDGDDDSGDYDSDDDDDDDLADVPDTREYTPIDVEGLQAMGLSQVGSNAPMYMHYPEEGDDDEDDDSDADDVKLGPDDAMIVVAKTEEVSFFYCVPRSFFINYWGIRKAQDSKLPSNNTLYVGFCFVGDPCL
jgi:hypothetical protein